MMTKDRYERESCGWMRNLELKLFASLLPSKLERFYLYITVFSIKNLARLVTLRARAKINSYHFRLNDIYKYDIF